MNISEYLSVIFMSVNDDKIML